MQILFRDKKQLFTEVEVASSEVASSGGESVNSAG